MKAFLASNFADEDGPMAEEGRTVYIYGSKEKLLELADFFAAVSKHIRDNETCHMHFRDHSKTWNKNNYIDIAVDIDGNA